MKRTPLFASAVLALGLVFTAGCSSFAPARVTATKRPLTYALIASVSGGGAPTDAQWATMQKKFGEVLAARGLTLVTDPTAADKLIQVLFIPDLTDPDTGTSYVLGVRNNPKTLVASAASLPTFGYNYYNTLANASVGFQPQFYGYFDDYSNNYNSTPTPPSGSPPSNHPGNHHVSKPVDCPPETPHQPPSGYAGGRPHDGGGSGGGHWWSPRPGSGSDSSGYSSSSYSSGYSRSSDSMGPSPSFSSSASSSQSLSWGSSSSSSDFSSSSSSSSSPSFSSGSSGSSGGGATVSSQKLD